MAQTADRNRENRGNNRLSAWACTRTSGHSRAPSLYRATPEQHLGPACSWLVCCTRSKAEYGYVFQDLEALGLHTQKKSYLYQERSLAARQAFEQELHQLSPEQCVYIDEAGVENTLDYAYGWSLKGTRCRAGKLGHFTERVSMIAAWCMGEVFAPMTFTGYCDSRVVETWFERVLLPTLQSGQTVILDNASFHRRAKLQALLGPLGCRLLPLSLILLTSTALSHSGIRSKR